MQRIGKYKVLACGSEGSLMQAVIPCLLKNNYKVIGVDNYFRYGKTQRKRNYQFLEGDLCDKDFVKKIFEKNKIDFVIQAAARIFGVRGFHKFPADILSSDISLHQNILRKAIKHRVKRVVYISSSMVYERAKNVPSKEKDIENMLIPLTDYGLSKLVGERLSIAFYKQYGLPYTIWRPFNIITPFEKGEEEVGISHVFADFIKKILIEGQDPIEILGDGEQIRSFTWIYEIAEAIAHYSFKEETKNKIFNLGQYNKDAKTEAVTMNELAQKIFQKGKTYNIIPNNKILKVKHIEDLLIRDTDVRLRIPDSSFAHQTFGWKTKVNVDKALDHCIKQIIKKGLIKINNK
ncbi:NAD-dependent epimerase/dehydratase family protein [Patescibacteria group bacterium AH-259-L07]|nr:NAD-dependent epimerase/dehydratase family protein [Patescibacteria group bacterium AH-259-L07]